METKKNLFHLVLGISAVLVCCFSKLEAVSLDGTTGTSIYEAASYPFANGDFALGFVQFASGFSVPVGGTVTIGVNEPVSGVINLGNGTINLSGDLHLAAGASILSSGGTIELNGYTIYLGDTLDLTAQSINIVATPSGTINGLGNRIILDPGNSTFFPTGTDITYRNVRFENCLDFNLNHFFMPISRFDNVSFIVPIGRQWNSLNNDVHLYRRVEFIASENSLAYFQAGGTGGNETLFIHSGATLYVGPGMYFTLGTNNNPVFDDLNSVMHYNNCIFQWLGPAETALTNGKLIIEGRVLVRRTNVTGTFNPRLKIGNGNLDQDHAVYILPGSTLEIANVFPWTTTLIYADVH